MFRNILIYGLGISGIDAAKFLIKNGYEVLLTDDNEKALKVARDKIGSDVLQNATKSVKFLESNEIEGEISDKTGVIFSPGIPLYFPKKHKILEIVEQKKAQIFCDIELFYLFTNAAGSDFVGITGTNGKSTSSALVDFIFTEINEKSYLAGNIGIPVFELMQKQNFANKDAKAKMVLEISSYQLDLINKTHFNVAALTNITPDHIDRHGSFANYVALKKKIFQNQKEGDFAVINVDDESAREVFEELNRDKNFKANLVAVSAKKIQENGVFVIDGVLHNKIAGNDMKFDLKGAILKGEHNMQNAALAFACVFCALKKDGFLGEEKSREIVDAILKFKGLRHRMQFLGNVDGVNFVNDSKATNAESTQKALQSYNNIFWILGGKAKDGGIEALKPYFSKVIKSYLIGEASDEFAKFLEKNAVKYEKCINLENAFKKAYFDAKNSDLKERNILLSPSCASFDQWKNFEERGDYFCKLFDEIDKN